MAAAIERLRLGESERVAAATLLSLLAHGERVAMRGADRQAQIAPDCRARRFLRAQARHEAFHARVFDTAGRGLMPDDSPGVALPEELAVLEQRLEAACDRRDFAATLLVQQVFLEGMGYVVLHRLDSKIAAGGDYLAHLRVLILRQEAAHHRFGVTMLARCVEDVLLSEKLLERTRPLLLDDYVTTDSRKFEQMGVWRSLLRCIAIVYCHRLRLPIPARTFFAPIR